MSASGMLLWTASRALLAIVFLVVGLLSCDRDRILDRPAPPFLGAFCCPFWLSSDSLLCYRDEGFASSSSLGLWATVLGGSAEAWLILSGDVYTADFSPAANSLVFERGTRIYVADIVNDIVDPLTIRGLTGLDCLLPRWNPDGTWIAFDRRDCDFGGASTDTTCGIFVVRPDGSDERFVVQGVYPTWSPDGMRLAYALRGEVYAVDFPLAQDVTQLSAFHDFFDSPPAVGAMSYAPNGAGIIVELRTRPDFTIWFLPAGGGNPRRLLSGGWPSYSPSGRLIAFISDGNDDHRENGTVWVYDTVSELLEPVTRRP